MPDTMHNRKIETPRISPWLKYFYARFLKLRFDCNFRLFPRWILMGLALNASSGCAPVNYTTHPNVLPAQLINDWFITPDGASLPVRQWQPKTGNADAILIAVHGFNDYSHFFEDAGTYLSAQGIACYAYDQRGFGASPRRGLWGGVSEYTQDLALFIDLIKQKHPHLPVYLLGESMGGAIVIATVTRTTASVDGIILSAPAVWARSTMPWYQTALLSTLSRTMPWLTLTGEGLEIKPSDNVEMLRALGRDPLVIKKTRVDALHGLADLMDIAFLSARHIDAHTLVLYGQKDEVIPQEPTFKFLKALHTLHPQNKTVKIYQNGYHMLLRDLQAPTVWQDIASWIHLPGSLSSTEKWSCC
ncbi:alpha/beta hydrolase [Methylicorpusculum oleiharenae]|uniref:alpha/beta hydrolase n=1 Tax=Methylicorpusculum oleiharenae TaxID=1338687 RepID=UPI001E3B75A7|nr:alpha/beta hydrolase [Methylicorpusculum oleiharenae]MCD2451512.1 alpha/beta hydrolase [Methylicorpusculum oleiharenae]